MGTKCPCANPPGAGKMRPIPRRPKVEKESKPKSPKLPKDETNIVIKKKLSRIEWIMARKPRYIPMNHPDFKKLPGFVS